ncbi:ABC transporter ATP-binding protein [Clostridium tyrobutyricum]|uniref:ABC transporter ATP-binding protein n=1 Tax=Clostridium tyrobutyricum TaxID=1519 RepID=UPI0002D7C66F|nr:ABC transporter ATP-binding protein [Clostridium tyrobutyricum]MBR9647962.1 ABC transporter ATP-binding protein [Clostridium tyrobutyricum]MBV4438098.1 ABC transporter ATP-binding protein [Clostridium tyrobutyricum]MBV4439303.1 ABC transporter ATP-binding protein [Clostridium tyrobutyricum]MBV4446421.1 ABC transporter ATP-binding protein [Clostridium tyrobutyricum]MBV4449536.1 ABC transporter ATP-binding protein [Clostridium tyrobutyricum]
MDYENAVPIVQIKNVSKYFGDNQVLKKINLDIYKGEFLTLLGSSGCGKTTTLRIIAGFEIPTEGSVVIANKDATNLQPYNRDVNTVFQSYALFPHMNVFDNIAFGLVEKKIKKSEIKKKVEEILELVQLNNFEKRKPSEMSGGQKQRVAIARALINNPKVLLLDEPLAALDLKLRKQMQLELKHLQQQLGVTFVYVTHDQEEALTMSDRIGVMNKGILEQIGTPKEIYEQPKTKFVADFIGESNIFEATVSKKIGKNLELVIEDGSVSAIGNEFKKNEIVSISVRLEHMKLSKEPIEGFCLNGVIKEHIYTGSNIKTVVQLPSGKCIKLNNHPDTELNSKGTLVNVYWDLEKAVVMHTKDDSLYNIINDAVFK